MSDPGPTAATDKVAFGRYKLLHLLAQGGMGEVYLAKLSGAAGFEKLCVLKTILPNFSEAEDFVQRFHHEAKTLVQLNHSNIAQIYDMGEADKTYYMALEYVAGVDLARVEKRSKEKTQPVPIPIALFIGQRMMEALGYAHRKTDADGKPMSIVHRDISPHNVLVSYEGDVKVIDFGLAKSAARSLHTLPATVLGKLGYMSPEQARAEEIDQRSDIFSAGVVVWELLAGRPMVKRGTFAEMLGAMAHPKISALSAIRPEISTELSETVQRALAVEPADRYERADDFAAALNEEFVKHKPVVSAEKVGQFIRGLCPEEFEQQRKLLSGISILGKSETELPSRPSIRQTPSERRSAGKRVSDNGEDDATALRESNKPPVPSKPPSMAKARPAEAATQAGELGPTFMRPSEIRPPEKSRTVLYVAIGGGIAVAGIAAALILRPASQPTPPQPTPTPAITATPTPAPTPPLPSAPTPTPPVPTVATQPTPTVAPPAPTTTVSKAPEQRKALERKWEALKKSYAALEKKVGGPDQVEQITAAAFDDAKSEFKKNIDNPKAYGDLDKTLSDTERYVRKAARQAGL